MTWRVNRSVPWCREHPSRQCPGELMTEQATSFLIIGDWSSGGIEAWFTVSNPAAEQLLAQVTAAEAQRWTVWSGRCDGRSSADATSIGTSGRHCPA